MQREFGLWARPRLSAGRKLDSMTPWNFAYVADIQVGSPRSFRFAPAWNDNWQTARRQIAEQEPEFLLVGGDLTRDGYIHRYELEDIKKDLEQLPFPVYSIPGNMDVGNKHSSRSGPLPGRDDRTLGITSQAARQFEEAFGPLWWSVEHKNVRINGICDMLLGSSLPEEQRLMAWLKNVAEAGKAQRQIWMFHYALFMDSLSTPNYDITDPGQYLDWYFSIDHPHRDLLFDLLKTTGTSVVISGHIHCRRSLLYDGIRFDFAPATCFSQHENRWPDGDPSLGFIRYTVDDEGVHPTFVPLRQLSTREGYGPGGHPSAEQRDYSLAWEK